jgi:hypothetical protein
MNINSITSSTRLDEVRSPLSSTMTSNSSSPLRVHALSACLFGLSFYHQASSLAPFFDTVSPYLARLPLRDPSRRLLISHRNAYTIELVDSNSQTMAGTYAGACTVALYQGEI